MVREIHNREEWNKVVLSFPEYGLKQGYEWGATRESQGWGVRRLAVLQGGVCVAAIALLIKFLPLINKSVLYAPEGPLLRHGNTTAWEALLKEIRQVAAQTQTIFLRVDPRVADSAQVIRQTLTACGFAHLSDDWTTWNSPRVVLTLGVEASEEEIKRNFRRRHREYIASAARRALMVRPATSLDEVIAFHASLAAQGRRKNMPVRNRVYFESLWNEYLRTGQGVLLLAEHHGEPVGGLLGAKLGHRALMFYVALRESSESGRLQPGPLLYWEFIRWAKAAGCTNVDWGGSGTHFPPRPEDPGYGVYHFKLGFNSTLEYRTGYYDLIFLPQWYRVFRTIERWGSDLAWLMRAQLNEGLPRMKKVVNTTKGKLRQFQVSLSQRGFLTTLYWARFGFFRVNRFVILKKDLTHGDVSWTLPAEVTLKIWSIDELRAWRKEQQGLSTEFFQDEIDGVDTCAIALVGEQVAAIAWLYRPDNHSRLFELQPDEAEINNVFVLPQYRGKGLHKALVHYRCHYLMMNEYKTAYTAVHEGNEPSLRATRGAGFQDVGELIHFFLYRPKFRASGYPTRIAPKGS